MSQLKYLTGDEMGELLSQFLIDSWSYSKVSTFARNEKAFEMSYIFNVRSRMSATTIAGQAYHAALDKYFKELKLGNVLPIADAQQVAYDYIKEVHGNTWKLQKTTPTVESCQLKCTATVNALLANFYSEVALYTDDIAEVIDVEMYCNEFISVNGVEIPLPCHARIDLTFRAKDGRIIIVDHKSKSAYTGDDEAALTIGLQAITYVNCFEAKTGLKVDAVWFVENKHSQNKDKSSQLQAIKVELNNDTRKLYEALLYEPLRKLISAVNDPDYVYIINDADNYVDRAELYDFWARTMISEVDDFNIDDSKKELIGKRLKKIRDSVSPMVTPTVIKEFKRNAASFIQYDLSHTNMTFQEKIEHVLRSFSIIVKIAHEFSGYSSNTYLLEVSAGIKVASIHKYKLDIANALNVATVRISNDLVVHEGKSYLAVEFAKPRGNDLIYDRSLLVDQRIPVGKDNYGNVIVWDLDNQSTPHMLVCGATGSGKSVFLESTIGYAEAAGVSRIVILDPKFEFTNYHSGGVEVYNEILDIETVMACLVEEMNERVKTGKTLKTLVVFDEFADAVSNARKGSELDVKEMVQVGTYAPKKGFLGMMEPGAPKMALKTTGQLNSLEENLRILLQKGRSCGFRIVAATQRASVKVITGDAKVNFPVQVCFRVPKEIDSKVVIDEAGAESLAGKGDGLIKSPEYGDVVRFQAFYKPRTMILSSGEGCLIAEQG